jgi:glycosyltransferase involved in cell wall biosynthesis
MRRALYVSPVVPRRRGVGLAQRAYRLIEALSHRHRVSLLTTGEAPSGAALDEARALCADVVILPRRRWSAGVAARRALRRWWPARYYGFYRQPSDWPVLSRADQRRLAATRCVRFDVIFVHRLYMLPLIRHIAMPAGAPVYLDFDDVESTTRDRLAALARLNGDRRIAYLMRRDAAAYGEIERRELATFERIFVCSEADRVRLLDGNRARRVDVLPNVVDVPEQASGARRLSDGPFVFLFVGSPGYYPNRDAIAFWCRDVVPLIRRRVSRPFQIRVVGERRPEWQRSIPGIAELSWAAVADDIAAEYDRADAVIVPVRAGGGTRIKVLEAFAHRRPVVSTTVGVEGLAVEHGEHALIADTAEELAARAVSLMDDAALGARLAAGALSLVQRAYTPVVLRKCLDDALR